MMNHRMNPFCIFMLICLLIFFASDRSLAAPIFDLSPYYGKLYRYAVETDHYWYIREGEQDKLELKSMRESSAQTVLYFDENHYLLHATGEVNTYPPFINGICFLAYTPEKAYMFRAADTKSGSKIPDQMYVIDHQFDSFKDFFRSVDIPMMVHSNFDAGAIDPFIDVLTFRPFTPRGRMPLLEWLSPENKQKLNAKLSQDVRQFVFNVDQQNRQEVEQLINKPGKTIYSNNQLSFQFQQFNDIFYISEHWDAHRSLSPDSDVVLDYSLQLKVEHFNENGVPVRGSITTRQANTLNGKTILDSIDVHEWKDMTIEEDVNFTHLLDSILEALPYSYIEEELPSSANQ